jgi:hypothetical protein
MRGRDQVSATSESKQWNEAFSKAGTVLMDISFFREITL